MSDREPVNTSIIKDAITKIDDDHRKDMVELASKVLKQLRRQYKDIQKTVKELAACCHPETEVPSEGCYFVIPDVSDIIEDVEAYLKGIGEVK